MVVHRARNFCAQQAGRVVPEALEVLLEQAGPHRAQVDPQQLAQATSLVGGHVLATLEQQPPRLGEHRGTTGGAQAAHLLSSHLVDGLVEKLGDVEAVEYVDGRRASRAHDVAERLPHVAGDEHDRLRTLFAQHVEEGVEGPDRAVTRHVQQALASVVDLVDEREVLVPLFPGQFVYADGDDCRRGFGAPAPSERRARRTGRRCPRSSGSAWPPRATTAPSPSSRETRPARGSSASCPRPTAPPRR